MADLLDQHCYRQLGGKAEIKKSIVLMLGWAFKCVSVLYVATHFLMFRTEPLFLSCHLASTGVHYTGAEGNDMVEYCVVDPWMDYRGAASEFRRNLI